MCDELSNFWNQEDLAASHRRTALHEAGHAVSAWHANGRSLTPPPFEYIDVNSTQGDFGVCEGGTLVNSGGLSPTFQGAIALGGIFAAETNPNTTKKDWQKLVDERNGTDGTDDYADAVRIANQAGIPWESFKANIWDILSNAQLRDKIENLANEATKGNRINVSDQRVIDIFPPSCPLH